MEKKLICRIYTLSFSTQEPKKEVYFLYLTINNCISILSPCICGSVQVPVVVVGLNKFIRKATLTCNTDDVLLEECLSLYF